tara:strand:+ start:199 stop:444 length:246 start_codon:yes stop_codon:yes gene_type:complete
MADEVKFRETNTRMADMAKAFAESLPDGFQMTVVLTDGTHGAYFATHPIPYTVAQLHGAIENMEAGSVSDPAGPFPGLRTN